MTNDKLIGKRLDVPEKGNDTIINNHGSTFWDWVKGDHSFLKKVFIGGFILVSLVLLYRISWMYPVFLIVSFGIGYFIFKNVIFDDISVRVLAQNSKVPTEFNIRLVGRKMFEMMTKVGAPRPFTTCDGKDVYLAEDMGDNWIKFAFVHYLSDWQFVLKKDAFHKVRDVADRSLQECNYLRHVPKTLALEEVERVTKKQNDYWNGILHGQSYADEILKELNEKSEVIEDVEKDAQEELKNGGHDRETERK
jgi:hypothetical protein